MPLNLVANSKITRHSNAVAAGQTVITPGTAIDMAGFESVTFLVAFGAITASAVTSIEVHCSSDDGAGDAYTALAGSNVVVTDANDNKVAAIDVIRPPERYVKCIVNRATADAAVDAIIAIQTGAKSLPVTADATIVGNEVHQSPAEGAA
jgi:hypothetical protein